jgi:tetratricopeptide (TPR) repeat protein
MNEGDFEVAATAFEQHLEAAERLHDPKSVSIALSDLAYASIGLGRYEEAVELASRSLEMATSLDPETDRFNLGLAYLQLGRPLEAATQFTTSLDIADRVGALATLSYALDGIASLAGSRADPIVALRLSAAAERLRVDAGVSAELLERQLAAATIQSAKSALAAQDAEDALASGRGLSRDEAVALARAASVVSSGR